MHPQPQLARSRWIDLTGRWGFAYDDGNRGLDEGWEDRQDVYTRAITVPFPPESPASGIGDPGFHPVVWYRRTFRVAPEDEDKRMILHCGAVDYRAAVWVNRRLVATHEGGQTPFSADITAALNRDGEQVIVVRAEDLPADLAQPRGKQDWLESPHDIWYHRTTGIWQPVWLEPVAGTHITGLRWTPRVDRGAIHLALTLSRASGSHLHIRIRLTVQGVTLYEGVESVEGTEFERDLPLDLDKLPPERNSILWTPENPCLIQADLALVERGEVVDEVQSYAGLRSVGVAAGRFQLNGRPYYLRLALEQGYWPQTHLAAPGEEALQREVELAKEFGFNGLRIHQRVADPRFLYWCDRLGLVVWGEMATAYIFSEVSIERFTREWMEVLARDFSHPCIVTWVPLNESWGVPEVQVDAAQQHFVRSIFHLTKALDPTRPVLANDGWEYLCGDILGIHDYSFLGSALRERYGSTERLARTIQDVQPSGHPVSLVGLPDSGTPVILTEFGGISFRPRSGEGWNGYGTVDDQEGFREKYEELVEAALDCPSFAGFCYTQLTDTAQETNGLLTEEREPKIDPALVRAINAGRTSSAF